MENTKYSAKLGDLCEKAAIRLWVGAITPDEDVLTRTRGLRREIIEKIKPSLSHRMTYVQEFNSAIASALQLKWNEYKEMLSLIDYYTGTSLDDEIDQTINKTPLNKDKFRYLFQASMVLASEMVNPTFSTDPRRFSCDGHISLPLPGLVIPNVTYAINGLYAGQYDALILPREVKVDETNFNFLDYLESRQPWSVFEIKTLFRTRGNTGAWRRLEPYGLDLKQYNHRMGELLSEWEQKHNDPQAKIRYDDPKYSLFPLPDLAIFCYLRGGSPTGIVKVKTKEFEYLSRWHRKVSYACCPVDWDGGETEGDLPDEEYAKRELEVENLAGEMGNLHFPLWALMQTAEDKHWEGVSLTEDDKNPKNVEAYPTTGEMITFDGQLIPEEDTRPKKKKSSKKYTKPKKKDQINLF